MLSVIMQSVVMLSVIMLNVAILSVIMLNVIYSEWHYSECRGAKIEAYSANSAIYLDHCNVYAIMRGNQLPGGTIGLRYVLQLLWLWRLM
jgi:hypothetical protein